MFLGLSVYADEPPDWNDFIIQSNNKAWSAVVRRKGNAQEPWEDQWEFLVYKGVYSEDGLL